MLPAYDEEFRKVTMKAEQAQAYGRLSGHVYSLQQAARRSWRIGQQQPVKVIYLGYADTSQMTCLGLMAKKITVSQSTSGDLRESALDVLDQDGDSVEVALARQLVR